MKLEGELTEYDGFAVGDWVRIKSADEMLDDGYWMTSGKSIVPYKADANGIDQRNYGLASWFFEGMRAYSGRIFQITGFNVTSKKHGLLSTIVLGFGYNKTGFIDNAYDPCSGPYAICTFMLAHIEEPSRRPEDIDEEIDVESNEINDFLNAWS